MESGNDVEVYVRIALLVGLLLGSNRFVQGQSIQAPVKDSVQNAARMYRQSNPTRVRSQFYFPVRVAQSLNPLPNQDPATTFQPTPQSNRIFDRESSTTKTVATRLKGFGIPFQLSNWGDSFIEVQLYVSRDEGLNWKFYGRQTTEREEFPFEADGDGEYWFAIKTLNRDRKLVPDGDPTADLKIIVDTVKPELDFRVESDPSGRVVCRWTAKDKNLTPESLQIFYQPMSGGTPTADWTAVPVQLSGTARNGIYSDQIGWWPETSSDRLNVAIQISDLSGNSTQLYRQLNVAPAAWRMRNQSTARVTDAPNPNQPIKNPWVQPESIPAPSVPPPTGPSSQTSPPNKTASLPPNVVCKDGVCTIQPKTERFAQQKTPGVIESYGSQQSYPPASQDFGPPIPRVNSFEPNLANLDPNLASQLGGASQNIEWPSETKNWVPKNQSSFATTRRPSPNLAPADANQPRQPVTNVPPNPSSMSFEGDQVVGQSSTQGPNNQYRGLNSNPNPNPPQMVFAPSSPGVQRNLDNNLDAIPRDIPSGQMQMVQQKPSPGSQAGAGQWTYPDGASDSNTNRSSSQYQQSGYRRTNDATGFGQTVEGRIERGPDANLSQPNRPSNSRSTVGTNARPSRAPVQIIGSKRLRLNYGIDSIDPSGVAKVDLWVTQDEGRTWKAWGSDPDNESPFPVEVDEERKYGFRIVVHSKDGLTGQGPSSGDDADMWIQVDTTAPLVRITSVPYGRNREAGRLVINYSVSDGFLSLRPLTLFYAANPKGPWNPIEEGLRNEGRYVWKPAANLPERIFLKLEATDKAGNVGVHTLSQAIDISGLIPRGTIHGVTPVGNVQ
jgi:hypothetical protein